MTVPAVAFDSGDDAQLLYRIPRVMRMLNMSRSVIFEQLRSGRLRSVRQGRARRLEHPECRQATPRLPRPARAAG